MNELASTYTATLITAMLHVHSLTNMHRASGNDEYRKSAADWLPDIERQMVALRRELTKEHHHAK